jgi:hypothetical protein
MSFKKVKSGSEFQDFIKNFNKRREKLKNIVVNKKIGEKEITDFAEMIHKPVTKAIESTHHPAAEISTSHLPIPSEQPLALPAAAAVASQSQAILQDVMSTPTSQRTTSTLEVNLGSGKLGKSGKINIVKLLNNDIVEFTHRKQTEIIPTTLGLLYLLLTPYKFILSKKLLNNSISSEDRMTYAEMINKAGVEDTVKGTSEKYNKIVLPIRRNQEQEGYGLNQKPRNAYKLDLSTGKFGKLHINVPLLMTTLTLVAYLNKKKVLEEKIDPNLIYLLTKRFNPKKQYSSKSVELFKKLAELSELNPAIHSQKLNLFRGGAVSACSKQYFSSLDELVDRLSLLTASTQAGNTSIDVKNEISEILDILLSNKCIEEKDYQKLYKNFLK